MTPSLGEDEVIYTFSEKLHGALITLHTDVLLE